LLDCGLADVANYDNSPDGNGFGSGIGLSAFTASHIAPLKLANEMGNE
jgi:hypothetical protein